MFGSRPYIPVDLGIPLGFLHCSSFIIIHFYLFKDCSRIIEYKFNSVIKILELKKDYCVTQKNASENQQSSTAC